MLLKRTLFPLGILLLLCFCGIDALVAQSVSSQQDVLVFVNGEKLIGQVVEATSKGVTFKSDMAGKVTAKWRNIRELHYGEPAAVVEKGVKLRWGEPFPNVPQGTVSVANGQVQVRPMPPAPPISVPVENLQDLVTTEEFARAMHEHPSFFSRWKGAATAGASLVVATQDERTYTSNISLVRSVPTERWLNRIRRTKITFNSAYGLLTQPGQPSVETSILHGEAQHDEYFTPSLFGFGDAAFDHNFAQGLDLQQTYGGGMGWTIIKTDSEELDLKGALTYMRQQFQTAQPHQNLIGSTFSEAFSGKFVHGLTLQQDIAVLPAWNNPNAYSAAASIAVTLPVYKRFGITVGILDNFLNNPPEGFKKNSFTFTTGATYTIGPMGQ